jgi:hypothetical protein
MSHIPIFMEHVKIAAGYARTASNAAATGDRISLENYQRCAILVKQWQAATDAATLSVNMYTAASSGSSSTGITINDYWYMEDVTAGTTADTWTKGTAGASVTTSATGSGVSYYILDIDAEDLFASGTSYPFIAIYHGGDGSSSNYTSADYFLYNPRYGEDVLPSAQS